MNIVAVRPHDLTPAELVAWRAIIERNPQFASPFFDPDYARLLGEFRPQVEVAVWRDGDRSVGFFPFERHRGSIGRPLGVKLADFQGVIAESCLTWTVDELLEGARLATCHFDHLLPNQPLAHEAHDTSPSPWIDVSRGYDAYLADLRSRGSGTISQAGRKRRKLEREHGTIRFTWNDPDEAALELLIAWKSAQRQRTMTFNILGLDWVRAFLERLRESDSHGVQAVVSTLRVGDRIVAVHFGMRTPHVLHYWFPAFDTEYDRFSPGTLLLLDIVDECARRAIHRVDLGKGDDPYKQSFANASDVVAAGAADRSSARRLVRSSWYRVRSWIRASPLRDAIRTPKRIIKQWAMHTILGAQ